MKDVTMGMTVHADDGPAGRVDDVLASDETGQPMYVVVEVGGLLKSDVVVPFEQVRTVDDGGVWLTLTRNEVKHAPRYDPVMHGSGAGLVSQAARRFGKD